VVGAALSRGRPFYFQPQVFAQYSMVKRKVDCRNMQLQRAFWLTKTQKCDRIADNESSVCVEMKKSRSISAPTAKRREAVAMTQHRERDEPRPFGPALTFEERLAVVEEVCRMFEAGYSNAEIAGEFAFDRGDDGKLRAWNVGAVS
jgi:hypothetical protein